MTCRHSANDPNCSKNYNRYSSISSTPTTPDSKNYEIKRVQFFEGSGGKALVIQVKYPNCSKCSFEGLKTIVYLGVTLESALMWKEIDPHFSDPKKIRGYKEAPSPAARFPGNESGLQDACEYAKRKIGLT